MNENTFFSLSAQTLQGALTGNATVQGVLTSPALMQAILTQGPMIINDYVFSIYENAAEYIFTVRRGSDEQSIILPKAGGVNFETDETLSLEDGILRVNTADEATENNTLPITSAAVATQIGNIDILLKTI